MPFPFLFGGINYGQNANGGIQVSSNGIVTFGGGSTAYMALGPSNPPKKSIHIGSKDSSWARVYFQDLSSTQRRVRLLFEGYSGSKVQAAVNVQWELSFYTNTTLTICVGGTNAIAAAPSGALFGVSNGAGKWLASLQPGLKTLHVINGLARYS